MVATLIVMITVLLQILLFRVALIQDGSTPVNDSQSFTPINSSHDVHRFELTVAHIVFIEVHILGVGLYAGSLITH